MYCAKKTTIPAKGKGLVSTGLAIAVPAGTCKKEAKQALWIYKGLLANCVLDGRVAPRSGLASKNFIDTGAGVIDADYRGEVRVLLFNFSDVDFEGMYMHFKYGYLLSEIDANDLVFIVNEGDRIAQLVLERVSAAGFG